MSAGTDVVPNLIQSIQLDWCLNFVDKERYQSFDNFYRKRKFIKAIIFYYTFFVLPSNIYPLFYNKSLGAWLFSVIFVFINILSSVAGWAILVEHKLPSYFDSWLNLNRRIYILSLSLIMLFTMVRNLFTSCEFLPESASSFVLSWHCDKETMIPNYTLPVLSLIPVGSIVCLCETRLDFVLLVMTFNFVVFTYFAVKYIEPSYYYDTIICAMVSGLICIDQHQFHIEIYLAYDKLAETLLENKRMQEENRAAELRSMIGNLTHDLKTPLQSFMAGIDIMAHNISEIIQATSKSSESSKLHSLQIHFDSLVQCFKNIRNTNTFMIMTINRCLDYTKASKGIKLAPKYDTIDLIETLSMPLQ